MQTRPHPFSSRASDAHHADLLAVLKSCQTMSGQQELEGVLHTLLDSLLQCTEADEAYVLRLSEGTISVAAHGVSLQNRIQVDTHSRELTPNDRLSMAALAQAQRTQEKIVLEDAVPDHSPTAPSSSEGGPRSVMCLPLGFRDELVALLYLEKEAGGFSPQHAEMAELLAAQAGISIHNAVSCEHLKQENQRRQHVEQELRRTQAYLSEGESISHTGSWAWDFPTGQLYWSEEVYRILGYPQSMTPTPELFLARIHPEDRHFFTPDTSEIAKQRSDRVIEFRVLPPDSSVRYLRAISHRRSDDNGLVIGTYGVVIDETERRGIQTLRDGTARVLEMIATGAPLEDVLTRLVLLIESQANDMLCSILLLDKDGMHVRHGAAPNLPEGYVRAINGAPIGPRAGSCGTAAYRAETVIVSDITSDPLWSDWKGVALAHGLRACWSAPIFSSRRRVLGTFAMYYKDVRSPKPEELRLIDVATHIAGIAIERKRTEQAIIESRDELQRVVESVSDCLWSADARNDGETRYRYLSPVIERVTQRPLRYFWRPSEHWFERWFSIVHPDDRSQLLAKVVRLVNGQSTREETEYRILLPNGEVRYLRDSIRTGNPVEHGYVRISGIFSDITARKQAEEALRHNRELLESIINGSTALFFVKDRAGRYMMVNKRFTDIVHLTQDAVTGKTDHDLFSPSQADAMRESDWKVLSTNSPLEFEQTVTHEDGQHIYFVVKSPLRDAEGRPRDVCGIATDITERKRLEEQLREAQKMEAIGKLAGGIAHDFNNLMTIVTGYSDLLRGALHEDPSLREKVDEIQKAGEQATSLTRQLLAFSRRQAPQAKVLNLNEVLAQMMRMLRRLVSENIEVSIVPGAKDPLVRSDRTQIEQVIMNLVINARDAMPEGGKLTISTDNVTVPQQWPEDGAIPSAPYVRLSVTDSGHGMSAETRARIFEPFFTTKDPGKGTGLGLSTAYGIVRQAEGRITVESEPGRGTTFQILLPQAQAEAAAPQPVPVGKARHGSETILVVEDQEGLRTLISHILQNNGYHVLTAQDGRQALSMAGNYERAIHLMITDIVMPHMGGRELAKAWPATRSETRILFMSGYVDDNGHARIPGQFFIEKPFSPESLLKTVREVLDTPSDLLRSA